MSKNYTQVGIGSPLEVGEGGQKIKSSTGAIEHRNAADDDYAIVRGADPVNANDLVTKGKIDALNAVTKEFTGFAEPESVIITYDAVARTINLTGTVTAYWQGNVITELVSGWTSPAHAVSPTSSLFLYYDGSAFQWSSVSWTFDRLQIAIIGFSSTGAYLFTLRESHGMMPWQCHKNAHENIGTWRSSGGDVLGLTLASTTPDDRRPLIGECTVDDEDLVTTLPAHIVKNSYSRMYLTGAGGVPVLITGEADIPWLIGGMPQFNEYAGGVWTNTPLSNNDYTSIWLMAIPAGYDSVGTQSQDARFIWWSGQSYSDSLDAERSKIPSELSLGEFTLAAPEFIFIEQVIIRVLDGNWEIIEQRRITGNRFSMLSMGGGVVTDHGVLTGLDDDDHPQYLQIDRGSAVDGQIFVWDAGTQTGQPTDYSTISASSIHNIVIDTGNVTGSGVFDEPAINIGSTSGIVQVLQVSATAGASSDIDVRLYNGDPDVAGVLIYEVLSYDVSSENLDDRNVFWIELDSVSNLYLRINNNAATAVTLSVRLRVRGD